LGVQASVPTCGQKGSLGIVRSSAQCPLISVSRPDAQQLNWSRLVLSSKYWWVGSDPGRRSLACYIPSGGWCLRNCRIWRRPETWRKDRSRCKFRKGSLNFARRVGCR
jgi:hypothetical protein